MYSNGLHVFPESTHIVLFLGVFSINLVTGECVLKSLTFSGIVGSHLNVRDTTSRRIISN